MKVTDVWETLIFAVMSVYIRVQYWK